MDPLFVYDRERYNSILRIVYFLKILGGKINKTLVLVWLV